MAASNLSGVPPVVTLSGLSGTGGFSGATQQSPSGQGGPGQGQATPGMTGGLDLMSLLALLGQQGGGAGDAGIGTGLGLGAGVGAGSFGQGGADLTGGAIAGAPMGGQSMVAGQTQGQAPGTGSGSIDPLSILQKSLGLAGKATGLLNQTASPTLGDTGGTSLSDQVRSAQGPSLNSTASPVYGSIDPATGLPTPGTQAQPQIGPDGVPLTGFGEVGGQGAAPGSAIGGGSGSQNTTLGFLQQAPGGPGGVPTGTPNQEMIQSLLGAGFTPDQITQVMGSLGGVQGFSAGEIPTGGSIPSSLSGTNTASPTTSGISGGGAAASGLGAGANILSLIQALKSGSVPGEIGAGVNTSLSLANLANSLGVAPEALSGTLGSIAPFIPLLGAALTGAGINPGTPQGAEAGGNAALTTIAGTEAAGAAGTLGGGGALAAASPALAAAAAPLAAFAPAVLGVVMAINQALNPKTNFAINKLAGQVGPNAVGGVENIANLTQGQDLSQLSTPVLENLVGREGSALANYYNPVGAGMGTNTSATGVNSYLTGLQKNDPAAYAQQQQALQTDQSSMLQAIAQLQKKGVGNDVIGNIMAPQLNNVWNMYNSGLVGQESPAGYTSPYTLQQSGQIQSQQQLADVYGGPTWLALNMLYGGGLGGVLGQYGINAPGLNLPQGPAQGAPASTPFGAQLAGYNPTTGLVGGNPVTPDMMNAIPWGAVAPTAGQPAGYIPSGGDWSA